MSIEELINKIRKLSAERGYKIATKADPLEIATLKKHYTVTYKLDLPDVYCEMLTLSNGVKFNGLTIWPTEAHDNFRESFLDANKNLSDTFNNEYVYFGMFDEELYVYEILSGEYKAIELVGQEEWEKFKDAKTMFEFMLHRALD